MNNKIWVLLVLPPGKTPFAKYGCANPSAKHGCWLKDSCSEKALAMKRLCLKNKYKQHLIGVGHGITIWLESPSNGCEKYLPQCRMGGKSAQLSFMDFRI